MIIRQLVRELVSGGSMGGGTPPPATAPVNTVLPAVTGDTAQGSRLATTDGLWNGYPGPAYTYQWQRAGVNISGATAATYNTQPADLGTAIRCAVRGENSAGNATANSNAITVTAALAPPVNTVAPVVSGATAQGSTLTTTNGTWTGAATITFAYQWQRAGVNIAGATSNTYVTLAGDVAAAIRCVVTGTNPVGSASGNSNAITVTGALAAPTNSVAPSITGSSIVGSVLTAANGTWAGNPAPTYTRQWYRDGVAISGATATTYTVAALDVGVPVTCRVTGTNSQGNLVASSNAIVGVTNLIAPANTVAPVVSGAAGQGSLLSTTNGTWTGNPTPTYTYQWLRNGSTIAGATSATYTSQLADVGASVTCRVTGTNSQGSDNGTSNAISVVAGNTAPSNTVAPAISGGTAVGSTLTATSGTWAGSPAPTYAYQWRRNGTAISGATAATYMLVMLDEGNSISCYITATNVAGSASASSGNITATAAPEPVSAWFGTQSTAGGGNWGGGDGRAMFDRFTLTEPADVVNLEVYLLNSVPAAQLKPLIYSDVSNAPGLLIAAGAAVTLPTILAGSPDYVQLPLATTLAPGNYWLGVVGNYYNYELGSGVHTEPQAVMIASGFNFASPQSTAPAVTGSYSNDLGIFANYLSNAVPVAPSNTSLPTIVGTARVGDTVTCSSGAWLGSPFGYGYQWQRDGVNISGATASLYTIQEDDVGLVIRCRVTATNDIGGTTVTTSNTVTGLPAPAAGLREEYFGTQNISDTSGMNTSYNRAVFQKEQLTYNGTLKSFTTYFNTMSPGFAGNFRGVVYSDVGGFPGLLLAASVPGVMGQVDGFVTVTLPGDVALTPGNYWLGIVADNHGHAYRTANGVVGQALMYTSNFSYATPPADLDGLERGSRYDYAPVMSVTFETADGAPDLDVIPVNTAVPLLTGTAIVGEVLTSGNGSWNAVPAPTFTYQWRRDGVAISGQTANTYTVVLGDVGHVLTCLVTATNTKGSNSTASSSRTAFDAAELALEIDLSYVVQTGARWDAFIAFVDTAVAGSPGYNFQAIDAAYAYKITGNTAYRTLAVNMVEATVAAAEAAIASNTNPEVAGDSYLHSGPIISSLATTYEWCASGITGPQRTRWAAFANQVITNIWNHTAASWGGRSAPWSGWAVNDPGNNYYYSFCTATAFWGLASDDVELLAWLDDNKFNPLRTYTGNLIGGGSREGTGYGASYMALFDLYEAWADSGQSELGMVNTHMQDSVNYWVHATMPTLNRYCPIGDLAREAYPNLYDYHRHIVLQGRKQISDATTRADASWWLNNISVQTMQQGSQRKYNLIDPGSNTSTPPAALNYYSAGTGAVFARNNWLTSGTFCHFLAGTYDQSHAAQQQGSFLLYKNNFLTMAGNIYSLSGIWQGVPANNVLRFNTSGGALINQNQGNAVNSVSLEADGSFVATANLKPIMANATITSWNRVADFDAPARLLKVTDSYAVTGGTTATFQFVVPSLPTVVGNVITCGDLTATVIVPGSPTITVVTCSSVTGGDITTAYQVEISGASGSFEVNFQVAA